MTDKYDAMRKGLMRCTLKELRALAKHEGICLGYDASRKDTAVGVIVANRRHRELYGEDRPNGDWHDHGVTAMGGIKDWSK